MVSNVELDFTLATPRVTPRRKITIRPVTSYCRWMVAHARDERMTAPYQRKGDADKPLIKNPLKNSSSENGAASIKAIHRIQGDFIEV